MIYLISLRFMSQIGSYQIFCWKFVYNNINDKSAKHKNNTNKNVWNHIKTLEKSNSGKYLFCTCFQSAEFLIKLTPPSGQLFATPDSNT